jgi:hypothetical protein
MKKTWQEKLEDKASLPKVIKLEKGFPCYNAVHKMGAEAGDDIVLVNPSEVVESMKQVPKGNLIAIVENANLALEQWLKTQRETGVT